MSSFGHSSLGSAVRGSALHWAIAGVVGVGLGVYMLVASSLPQVWGLLLMLAAILPFVAMIFGDVRKLLLAIIILDIPLQVDAHLAFRPEISKLGSLGGFGVSLTTLSLALLYALWMAELLAGAKRWPHSLIRQSLAPAAYLAVVTLSVLVASDVYLALFEVVLLLQAFLLFVYVVGTVRTRQDLLFIVSLLLVGLVLESLAIVGVRMVGHTISFGPISVKVAGSRVGGTLGHPNFAGSYLGLLMALALGLMLTDSRALYRWLAVVAFGLGGVALLFTFSRGAWLAFAVSAIVLCLLAWHRGWLSLTFVAVLALFVLMLALLYPDVIMARLFGVDGGAAQSRLPLMQLARQMIRDHPLLGVGANNFAHVVTDYITPGFARAWISTVHNKYLLVWSETGILGLVTFVGFLLVTIRRGWQSYLKDDSFLSPLALGLMAGLIGHMFHLTVDIFRHRPQVQLLWLIAGLIAAIRIMGDDEAQSKLISSSYKSEPLRRAGIDSQELDTSRL